jgi:hypothetical protein
MTNTDDPFSLIGNVGQTISLVVENSSEFKQHSRSYYPLYALTFQLK